MNGPGQNRKPVEQMTRAELLAELRRLNPFGGYGDGMPVAILRRTLRNYRRAGGA